MKKIILFGAGRRLKTVVTILNKLQEFIVTEIWDNDKRLWGNIVSVCGREVAVRAPHYEEAVPVLILPEHFYEQIRAQLTEQLEIPEDNIVPWQYCLSKIKAEIRKRYHDSADPQIRSVMEYLEFHELNVFFDFAGEGNSEKCPEFPVWREEENGLVCSRWKGKKIYFKRSMSEQMAVSYLAGIVREQSACSPHCYRQPGFAIMEKDVVADAGAAEGFFSLECIDRAKKIYVIESDPEWVEALQHTFADWKEKVEIVERRLSDRDDGECITLDTLNQYAQTPITFLKMDIEGDEMAALKGGENMLYHNTDLRVIACTYHRGGQSRALSDYLLRHHFTVSFSDGYMFFPYGEEIMPQLRHGLVLGKKSVRKKVFVWGIGAYAADVINCIDQEKAVIRGMIDSMGSESGGLWMNEWPVCRPEEVKPLVYDLIIVSVKNYGDIIKTASNVGLRRDKLLFFWNEEDRGAEVFEQNRVTLLLQRLLLEEYQLRLANTPYEYHIKQTFSVLPAEELLIRLKHEKASLCRFGDGEFEMIRGKERPWFQKPDRCLSDRLFEILHSEEKNVLLAIPDIFGSLEVYTEYAADKIRQYLDLETREEVGRLIPANRTFYDAYVTRPYLIYRDKEHANVIFKLFQDIWKGRNVLLIEGEYSRTGVGNRLLEGTKSVRRIIAPAQDAFACYDRILECALAHKVKDMLALISLGPTATVLAYDLTCHGIQAVDIGQLDNEYEWSLCKAESRVPIAGKGVAELSWHHAPDAIPDETYERQIVAKILK